jgi:hypothetical protein
VVTPCLWSPRLFKSHDEMLRGGGDTADLMDLGKRLLDAGGEFGRSGLQRYEWLAGLFGCSAEPTFLSFRAAGFVLECTRFQILFGRDRIAIHRLHAL